MEEPQAISPQSTNQSEVSSSTFISKFSTWSQLIVSLLTLVAIIFTAVQWYESRRTREMEYRAYVAVKGVVLRPRTDEPQTSDLIVVYGNTGRTPGYGRIKSMVEARENPLPEIPTYPANDVFESRLALFPQIDLETTISSQTNPEPAGSEKQTTQRNNAKATQNSQIGTSQPSFPTQVIVQTKKYYAHGIIEYKDIFGKLHSTKFCYVNVPGTRPWLTCASHNDSD